MSRRGTMEVEHLLQIARNPSIDLADALDQLSADECWRRGVTAPEIPFGDWCNVVTTYCRGGYDGLLDLNGDDVPLNFVVGLLVELRGTDSLICLAQILQSWRVNFKSEESLESIVSGLNLLPMLEPRADPNAVNSKYLNSFLCDLLSPSFGENLRGSAMCALRHYGDQDALVPIANAPRMQGHWESARVAAKRAIMKRIRRPASF